VSEGELKAAQAVHSLLGVPGATADALVGDCGAHESGAENVIKFGGTAALEDAVFGAKGLEHQFEDERGTLAGCSAGGGAGELADSGVSARELKAVLAVHSLHGVPGQMADTLFGDCGANESGVEHALKFVGGTAALEGVISGAGGLEGQYEGEPGTLAGRSEGTSGYAEDLAGSGVSAGELKATAVHSLGEGPGRAAVSLLGDFGANEATAAAAGDSGIGGRDVKSGELKAPQAIHSPKDVTNKFECGEDESGKGADQAASLAGRPPPSSLGGPPIATGWVPYHGRGGTRRARAASEQASATSSRTS
jgi:hypothetical protein